MSIRRFATKAVAVLLSLALPSCIVSYRGFPVQKLGAPAPTKAYAKLYYHVDGVSLAGGHIALADTLKFKSPFKETEVADEPPAQGLFVNARIKNLMPSLPSLIFGYISIGLLTLTPAWTTRAGSDLVYDVYVDGKKLKSFDYRVRRKAFLWIVLLPFAWANLFTASEEQAFEATALQFFDDADALFRTASTPAP
jgi:hypothetical protein